MQKIIIFAKQCAQFVACGMGSSPSQELYGYVLPYGVMFLGLKPFSRTGYNILQLHASFKISSAILKGHCIITLKS